jgi:hypothetical protein
MRLPRSLRVVTDIIETTVTRRPVHNPTPNSRRARNFRLSNKCVPESELRHAIIRLLTVENPRRGLLLVLYIVVICLQDEYIIHSLMKLRGLRYVLFNAYSSWQDLNIRKSFVFYKFKLSQT